MTGKNKKNKLSVSKEEIRMNYNDLTQGPIKQVMLKVAGFMIFGNLLQHMYNIANTWIVGRYLGSSALGIVGSAYALMTLITSILMSS